MVFIQYFSIKSRVSLESQISFKSGLKLRSNSIIGMQVKLPGWSWGMLKKQRVRNFVSSPSQRFCTHNINMLGIASHMPTGSRKSLCSLSLRIIGYQIPWVWKAWERKYSWAEYFFKNFQWAFNYALHYTRLKWHLSYWWTHLFGLHQ